MISIEERAVSWLIAKNKARKLYLFILPYRKEFNGSAIDFTDDFVIGL